MTEDPVLKDLESNTNDALVNCWIAIAKRYGWKGMESQRQKLLELAQLGREETPWVNQ